MVDATGKNRPACREGLSPVYSQHSCYQFPDPQRDEHLGWLKMVRLVMAIALMYLCLQMAPRIGLVLVAKLSQEQRIMFAPALRMMIALNSGIHFFVYLWLVVDQTLYWQPISENVINIEDKVGCNGTGLVLSNRPTLSRK
uniref:Uncharacterized protein n=1 Tax=Plectus sambesii TaxID=2011161 RepID=A0A914WT49_9BILA